MSDEATTYQRLMASRPDLSVRAEDAPIQILSDEPRDTFGVVYQDRYIIVIRDRVRFADGSTGSYLRIATASTTPGVVILPTIGDHIVLVRHFRHATGRWHWEAPRGFGDGVDADPASSARRELLEELGVNAESVTSLGTVYPDSGLFSAANYLYLARITKIGLLETHEAIDDAQQFTMTQFDAMIRTGEMTDGFTIAAVAAARARSLLA